jgi:hypothetical protein
LSNPNNDFSGGTVILQNAVQFNHVGAMGAGNVSISGRAAAIAGYPIDQAFLTRIDPSSSGLVMLGVTSDNDLDFGAARLLNASIDAVPGARFNGRLTGAMHRLGGATGSNFILSAAQALSGTADVEIVADAPSGGAVTFANSYTVGGHTNVRSGTLMLTPDSTFSAGTVEVMRTGVMKLQESTLVADTVTIQPGGVLTGCGRINANVVNHGTIMVSGCGLQFAGSVTNNGTLTVIGTATLAVDGALVNNGVVDLINAAGIQLPAGFVNNGVVFDPTRLPPLQISKAGASVFITIDGFIGHGYVLQRSTSPYSAAATWQDVSGPVRPGVAAPLTFTTFTNGAASFFRVKILP